MTAIENTVFISYRRTDFPWALAVYQNLTSKGYDVFFDVTSISGGAFEQIVIGNIKARAHFLVILTPSALERCSEPGDWLRHEIETAINEKRNITPLFFNGFSFSTPSISKDLTGTLAKIKEYNALEVPIAFFEEAMDRLSNRYLNVALDTVLHPVSDDVQKAVIEQQVAANEAIALKKDTKEKIQSGAVEGTQKKKEGEKSQLINKRTIILLVLIILVSVLSYIFWPSSPAPIDPTPTNTIHPPTGTPIPTITPIPAITPLPTLGVGSTMTSLKDGMTLLYIPAGDFAMGSNASDALAECQKFREDCMRDTFIDEEPLHSVNVDAFWIDQTEITNSMYASCVRDGECEPPSATGSYTRESYYDDPEFDDYPVIYITWDNANIYCEWAGRRLPTEAEWEKTAGWNEENQTKTHYPWGNLFDGGEANFCDDSCPFDGKNVDYFDGYEDTAPVGSYPAGQSYYGTYDMTGNVWEWVADWYNVYPGGDVNASNEFGKQIRVLRGGSFLQGPNLVRSSDRLGYPPTKPNSSIGFRCALSATE